MKNATLSFPEIIGALSERDGYKLAVAWAKLYRRELFSSVTFPVGRIHEDQYVIHKLYFLAERTATVDMRLYHHINRSGSISASSDFAGHMDDLDALFSRAEFLRAVGYSSLIPNVAMHMSRLLEYYLGYTRTHRSCRQKCRYIRRILAFARREAGVDSFAYKYAKSIYCKSYMKYRILACLFGSRRR